MADGRARVACVVVTHDALPWIEQCLASVADTPTVVVDNGSSDGTPDAVRAGFPSVRVIEASNDGLAVREAFFVSFLGSVGVPADTAFAAGFLFFLVTTLLALPGALILLFEAVRGGSRPPVEHG